MTLPKSIKRPVSGSGKDSQTLSNFDCVFWFGDLNFRITKERDKVVKKVFDVKDKKSSNYEDVLQHDELSKVLHNSWLSFIFEVMNLKSPGLQATQTFLFGYCMLSCLSKRILSVP